MFCLKILQKLLIYAAFCLYLKLYLTSRTRRLLLSTVFMSDTIFHIFSLNSYSRALKKGVGWPSEVKKRKLKTHSIFAVQANLGLKRSHSCGKISCNLSICVKYLILAAVLTNGPQNLNSAGLLSPLYSWHTRHCSHHSYTGRVLWWRVFTALRVAWRTQGCIFHLWNELPWGWSGRARKGCLLTQFLPPDLLCLRVPLNPQLSSPVGLTLV